MTQDKERLRSCEGISFIKDMLSHENTKKLFTCAKWDKKFPELYQAIGNIKKVHWDTLFGPLNKYFLNDTKTRNELIHLTKKLNEKGGLDSLGKVIVSLNESNFYRAVYNAFKCSKRKSQSECVERDFVFSEKELSSFLKDIVINKTSVENFTRVLGRFNDSLDPISNAFKSEVIKFYKEEGFRVARNGFVSETFKKLAGKKSFIDREFLSLLSSLPSFHNWISEKMSEKSFLKIFDFPVGIYPELIKDLKGSLVGAQNNFECKTPNYVYRFNVDRHVESILRFISNNDSKSFNEFITEDLNAHIVASGFCPNVRVYSYGENKSSNFIRAKVGFLKLFQSRGENSDDSEIYDLAKVVVETQDGLKGVSGHSNLFLVEFLAGDWHKSISNLVREFNSNESNIVSVFYRIIKNYDETDFSEVATLIKNILSRENDDLFEGIYRWWKFLTKNEKEFLFNYIDKHFDKDVNLVLLFKYYKEIMEISAGPAEQFTRELVKKDDKMVFDSIMSLSREFSQEGLLKDFRSFFSADHFMDFLEVVATGKVKNSGESRDLETNPISGYEVVLSSTIGADVNNYDIACASSVLNFDGTFNDFLRSEPSECRHLSISGLLGGVSDFGERYKQKFGSTSYLSDDGIFNSDNIATTVSLLKYFDLYLERDGSSYKKAQHRIQRTLLGPDYPDFYKDIGFVVANSVSLLKEEEIEELKNDLGKKLFSNENARSFRLWGNSLSKILKDYSRFSPKGDKRLNSVIPCGDFLNENIGGDVCPSQEKTISSIHEMVSILARKNGKKVERGIIQFLKLLSTSSGLKIPYKSEKRDYILTLFDNLRLFQNLTDPNDPNIIKDIEYINPKGKTSVQKTKKLERMEFVIRNVSFDNNYLGAHYKNSMAKAYDFTEVSKKKVKLFKFCVKIGFCGKFMNKKKKYMAKNAIVGIESLVDLDEEPYKFGDYLMGILTALVSSSSKISQSSSIIRKKKVDIPWLNSKKQLLKHNGVFLTRLADIGGFTNMARYALSRFGSDKETYFKNISSKKFTVINDHFLKNISPEEIEEQLVEGLSFLETVKNKKGERILDVFIGWIYNEATDKEISMLENVVVNSLVITSYLGKVNHFSEYSDHQKDYLDISLQSVLKSLPLLLKSWPLIYDSIKDKGIDFQKFIFILHDSLEHLAEGLLSKNSAIENEYYDFVNLTFKALEATALNEKYAKSIELFLKNNNKEIATLTEKLVKISDKVSQVDFPISSEGLGDFVGVLSSNKVNYSAYQEYLLETFDPTSVRYNELLNTAILLFDKDGAPSSEFELVIEKYLNGEGKKFFPIIDRLLDTLEIVPSDVAQ